MFAEEEAYYDNLLQYSKDVLTGHCELHKSDKVWTNDSKKRAAIIIEFDKSSKNFPDGFRTVICRELDNDRSIIFEGYYEKLVPRFLNNELEYITEFCEPKNNKLLSIHFDNADYNIDYGIKVNSKYPVYAQDDIEIDSEASPLDKGRCIKILQTYTYDELMSFSIDDWFFQVDTVSIFFAPVEFTDKLKVATKGDDVFAYIEKDGLRVLISYSVCWQITDTRYLNAVGYFETGKYLDLPDKSVLSDIKRNKFLLVGKAVLITDIDNNCKPVYELVNIDDYAIEE